MKKTPNVLQIALFSLSVVLAIVVITLTATNQPKDLLREQAYASSFIVEEDFNDEPTGLYTVDQLKKSFKPTWENGVAEKRVSIVEDGGSNKALKATVHGNWKDEGTGITFVSAFPTKHDEVYYSYRFKFGENFTFVKGGKLPGIGGGKGNTGGNKPNGQDGFSVRAMWRREGKLVQYVYHPDQKAQTGDDFDWNIGGQKYAKPNTWYTVQTRVRLNTPGEKNGIIQTWLDGTLVLDRQDIRFRDTNALLIDMLRFETFFGGNDPTWASPKDEELYFDDVKVSSFPFSQWTSQPPLANVTSRLTPIVVSPTRPLIPEISPSRLPTRQQVPIVVSPTRPLIPEVSPNRPPTVKPTSIPTSVPVSTQLTITSAYTANWSSGFCAVLYVKNNSQTQVNNWQANFVLQGATVTNNWNGSFTNKDTAYTVTPKSFNKVIKPGKEERLGFCARKQGEYQIQNLQVKAL